LEERGGAHLFTRSTNRVKFGFRPDRFSCAGVKLITKCEELGDYRLRSQKGFPLRCLLGIPSFRLTLR